MKIKLAIGFLLLVNLIIFSSCQSDKKAATELPNIVIIFTDDQGYEDLSSFGSETISTPNIDQLAENGMKFTDFHVAASVYTTGNTGLNPAEQTIAEILKKKGYRTAMAGKWHLGHMKKFLPLQHGFDQYFGIPYSNDMSKGELPLIRGNEVVETEPDQSLLTKRYTEFCVDFIDKKSNKTPFF
ncbi:MAG: sulfatase-like hydrolase/transferase [Saprospiraceae bacterium]|nr:sulfatase-like hydrolase/transferase [Saprospiraceae bacterium]